MEFYFISDSKIKVSFTSSELDELGIQQLDGSLAQSADFKAFLEGLSEKTGFDTTGRLSVKMFSSHSGGGDIYITRIKCEERDEDLTPYVFQFTELAPLSGACKYIESLKEKHETSVYYEHSHGVFSYYLLFYPHACTTCGDIYPLSVICEYCARALPHGKGAVSYITEKCSLIAEDNASRLLADLY